MLRPILRVKTMIVVRSVRGLLLFVYAGLVAGRFAGFEVPYFPSIYDWLMIAAIVICFPVLGFLRSPTPLAKSQIAPLAWASSIQIERQIIILVHGIRTQMRWRRVLIQSINDLSDGKITVIPFKYGYFSVFQFFIPYFSRRIVRKFVSKYHETRSNHRDVPVSIIAHSFGTWVVWQAALQSNLQFHKVLLCGTLIPEDSDESHLPGWFDEKAPRVKILVNDIAQKDIWVLLAKLFVPRMGAGGLLGLAGLPTPPFLERVFAGFSHNSFFTVEHYREHWLPILLTDQRPSERGDAQILPLFEWVINLRYLIYLILAFIFAAAIYFFQVYSVWDYISFRSQQTYLHMRSRPLLYSEVKPFELSEHSCIRQLSMIKNSNPSLTEFRGARFTVEVPTRPAGQSYFVAVDVGIRRNSAWRLLEVDARGAADLKSKLSHRAGLWSYSLASFTAASKVSFVICAGSDDLARVKPLEYEVYIRFLNIRRY